MRLLIVGGGTAGHMLPLAAVIEEYSTQREAKRSRCIIAYIGEGTSLEKAVFHGLKIKFYKIFAGKLRRYFSLKNFIDIFKIPIALIQSLRIIRKFKPDVIFSKGGYVSVPVVIAGFLARVPIVIHESDTVPGLATKLAAKFAKKICVGFSGAAKNFPSNKIFVTGIPVRGDIARGSISKALEITGFRSTLPTVLIMGGSQGAAHLNSAGEGALKKLIKKVQIIHITGRGKFLKISLPNYYQTEFVTKELKHFYKLADLIVSRAGANAIAEIQTLGKPNILIPLGRMASRGDQIENARIMKKEGSIIIEDKKLTAGALTKAIFSVLKNPPKIRKNPLHLSAAKKIVKLLQ